MRSLDSAHRALDAKRGGARLPVRPFPPPDPLPLPCPRRRSAQVQTAWISARSEIAEAIVALKKQGAEALLLADNPMMNESMPRWWRWHSNCACPASRRHPVCRRGRTAAVGADIVQVFRQRSRHADRILRGADPKTAIEEPTKYELVVNLKTARPSDSKCCRLYWPARPCRGRVAKRKRMVGAA